VKRKAGRSRIAQVGSELHVRDQIVAAILPPIRDGRGGRERAHPLAQALGYRLETGLIETIYPVDHEWRKHVVAGIIEDPMIDREQQVVDRPVDPAGGVMLLPAAGGLNMARFPARVPSP
jgi:hypothetical protein